MIINDFNLIWTWACPQETDSVLIIDSNTILASTLPGELLQPIAWWYAYFIEHFDRVELIQFSACDSPKGIWAGLPGFTGADAVEDIFRALGFEILDH